MLNFDEADELEPEHNMAVGQVQYDDYEADPQPTGISDLPADIENEGLENQVNDYNDLGGL